MNTAAYTLDTSVVIRLLTRDPLPLFQQAAAFMLRWKDGAPGFFVSELVLAEAYYALQHHYGYTKVDALAALTEFTHHPAICVSVFAQKTLTLSNLSSTKPGFVDRLIHGASETAGTSLVTFEKSARNLANTLVLTQAAP